MYIKLYVSEDEKKHLEDIAKSRNIALSKLCYGQILPLLHHPLSDSVNPLSHSAPIESRTKTITLHLTDSEYCSLEEKAKGTPLSKYIRNTMLYKYEPIQIHVYSDDISALSIKVSGYISQFRNFVSALALRRQLYESDYERLIKIADDTQVALQDVTKYTYNNRVSIRASGVRILRKEIKKAIEQLYNGKDLNT